MEPILEVVMNDLDTHPQCPHGPTLLFKRKYRNEKRMFYACAACRDRKLCHFFHWADEEYTEKKRKIWELERNKLIPEQKHSDYFLHCCKVHQQLSTKKAGYCHTCSELLLPNQIQEHKQHDILSGVTQKQILHPSELLKPLQTNSKEAQYLFSKSATKTIVNAAKNSSVTNFICIGVPRIHEYITVDYHEDMQSLLLDIDKRYLSFYKPEQFCWFNAFNNHFFFGDTSKTVLSNFLQLNKGEGMMIVMDPPFGGRIEPLAYTIKEIQKLHRGVNPHIQEDIRVMLISPYFMEPHILDSFPDFQMLDYKVDYDNHPLFSQGAKARKLGSPVRIFTNISPGKVSLPIEEGYRFCNLCDRWVSQENRHCEDCMKCTSKNGCTYVHCFKCQRCVKPTWKHCNKCQRCCLVPHQCSSFVPSSACYKCGKTGHKKYSCPETSSKKEEIASIATNKENQKRKWKQVRERSKKKKKITKA